MKVLKCGLGVDTVVKSVVYNGRIRIPQDIATADGRMDGTISASVSSPGAERPLRIPEDIVRFSGKELGQSSSGVLYKVSRVA